MTHNKIRTITVLTLFAAGFSTRAAVAADTITVPWNKLCQVAAGRELTVTTTGGEIVQGYCAGTEMNEIQVNTGGKGIVKIARKTLSRIDVYREKSHQLRSLGNGVREGLRFGWDSMLSPLAPIGIAAVPATLAWGAVAAPFCALGDLRAKLSGKQQIKPM